MQYDRCWHAAVNEDTRYLASLQKQMLLYAATYRLGTRISYDVILGEP